MRNPVREAEERSVDRRPVFAICHLCGEVIHGADNLYTGDDYVELNGSPAHYECAKDYITENRKEALC